jgi:DNA-binding CsgD family transcriptional regulator/uncharacterized membrane protein (DUF485 family)
MKLSLKSSDKHGQLHSIMVPSIILIFFAANYIVFTEVGPLLHWNLTFCWLCALIILSFVISWIYVGAINMEYKKVKAAVIEIDTVHTAQQAKLRTLSRKERQVLNLILEGKNNQQISDELFISMSTLKSHITHIYRKMEVGRRQEIMALFG